MPGYTLQTPTDKSLVTADPSLTARSRRRRRFASPVEAALLLASLAFVLPVVLIFITSLKPDAEIVHFAGLLPQHPTLENFRHIFTNAEEVPVFRRLFNSLMISSSITILVLIVDSLAAFALARLELPGGKVVFGIILAT